MRTATSPAPFGGTLPKGEGFGLCYKLPIPYFLPDYIILRKNWQYPIIIGKNLKIRAKRPCNSKKVGI